MDEDGLLRKYPPSAYSRLIVLQEHHSLFEVAMTFIEAADRLADSYSGQPQDDLILTPWLYLHRHATELELKDCIIDAAKLRRSSGDNDPDLLPGSVREAIGPRGAAHRLSKLLHMLDVHRKHLTLDLFRGPNRATLEQLAATDRSGSSHRYPPQRRPNQPRQTRSDFPDLNTALQSMHTALGGIAAQQDALLSASDDLESDFRAVYGDWF